MQQAYCRLLDQPHFPNMPTTRFFVGAIAVLLCLPSACHTSTDAPDAQAAVVTLPGHVHGASYAEGTVAALPAARPYLPDVLVRDGAWTLTPSVSIDGQLLAFVRWDHPVLSGPDSNIQQLYLARRAADGSWGKPSVVPAFADARVDYPHFSPDGRHLYLSSTRPHPGQYRYPDVPYEDFDLWRIPFQADTLAWQRAGLAPCADCVKPKTPSNWNVRYVNNETSPRLDLAGNLYYWTEREGTGGLRDVFVAPTQLDVFGFAPERRLPFNSTARESGVAVTRDGRTVVFASERAGGGGGSDLYRVELTASGAWSTPRAIAGADTRYDEGAPELVGDSLLLFTSNAPIEGHAGANAGEGAYRINVFALPFEQ